MKIRTDFVTNSSSSSFVLIFSDPVPFGIKTEEDLIAYYKKAYGADFMSEDAVKEYGPKLKDGKTLVFGSIERSGDAIDDMSRLAENMNATIEFLPD